MRRAEQLGPFRYVQSEDCFPLGQDTLLLAGFASLRPCWRVCDLGCGAGALPLLLLARESSLDLSGVELDGEKVQEIGQAVAGETLKAGVKIKKGKKVFHRALLG